MSEVNLSRALHCRFACALFASCGCFYDSQLRSRIVCILRHYKQVLFCRFLVGSPKTRSSSDEPVGTAPYLKAKYDEKYASGTLYSCPFQFNSAQEQCSPARPSASNNPNDSFNNRDAYGTALVGGGGNNKNAAVSLLFDIHPFYLIFTCRRLDSYLFQGVHPQQRKNMQRRLLHCRSMSDIRRFCHNVESPAAWSRSRWVAILNRNKKKFVLCVGRLTCD